MWPWMVSFTWFTYYWKTWENVPSLQPWQMGFGQFDCVNTRKIGCTRDYQHFVFASQSLRFSILLRNLIVWLIVKHMGSTFKSHLSRQSRADRLGQDVTVISPREMQRTEFCGFFTIQKCTQPRCCMKWLYGRLPWSSFQSSSWTRKLPCIIPLIHRSVLFSAMTRGYSPRCPSVKGSS